MKINEGFCSATLKGKFDICQVPCLRNRDSNVVHISVFFQCIYPHLVRIPYLLVAKLILLYMILISIRLFFLFSYDSQFIKERQRECPRICQSIKRTESSPDTHLTRSLRSRLSLVSCLQIARK